jgi:quercetin dioxygenase-like cupin family protein
MKTRSLVAHVCLLLTALGAWAQVGRTPILKPIGAVRFERDSDVKCLGFATESGDPNTGPSTQLLDFPKDCVVPWHYHTAEEQLMVVQGRVLTEMEAAAPVILGPGGFGLMPSKQRHRFSCKSQNGCRAFVSFDRTYDIFWVKD